MSTQRPGRLKIRGLTAAVQDTPILQGVDLAMQAGQVHAIMGPNGSGKSTLAQVLMGHPSYNVTGGSILYEGEEIGELEPHLRARKGIFLAFQYPYEIEGLPFKDLLRTAYNAWYGGTEKQIGVKAFHELLQAKLALLGLDPSFVERGVNAGFSGGEKKQAEILQLAVLQPKLAILDEIDSGLDVDALRRVCNALQAVKQENPDMCILLITHYNRILHYIVPDQVHIMKKGSIVQSGSALLAQEIEQKGYGE